MPHPYRLPCGAVVASAGSLLLLGSTALLGTAPADAQEVGAIFCKAVARLVPSEPVIGAVYVQTGAECAKSKEIEARVETKAFRDGVLIQTSSGACPRGRFWRNQVCEIPGRMVTNPAGPQSFEVKVTVKFTTDKNNHGDSITEGSTSGRY